MFNQSPELQGFKIEICLWSHRWATGLVFSFLGSGHWGIPWEEPPNFVSHLPFFSMLYSYFFYFHLLYLLHLSSGKEPAIPATLVFSFQGYGHWGMSRARPPCVFSHLSFVSPGLVAGHEYSEDIHTSDRPHLLHCRHHHQWWISIF